MKNKLSNKGYIKKSESENICKNVFSFPYLSGVMSDTFAPLGPFMATVDEIDDLHNMNMWLKVNGEQMQDGNTSNLIFGVQHVISYLSQFMSLLPGDVISTGTPAGVGMGMKPEKYLKPGDVVELGAVMSLIL